MAALLKRISHLLSGAKPAPQKTVNTVTQLKPLSQLSEPATDIAFYRFLLPDNKTESRLSLPQKLVIQCLEENIERSDFRQAVIPRLPSVIPKLMRSLRDPRTSARDYVDIIKRDPSLTAGVVKLANSVYFNPTDKSISDIETAVVKLGTEGIRSVLSAVVMQPVIERKSSYFRQFGTKLWQHSLYTAIACEIAAKSRGLEPYKAYLLGLMHDIGKITLFAELCKEFKLNPADNSPPAQAFIPILQDKSIEMSKNICESWNMDKEIITALDEQKEAKAGASLSNYGALLYQCNLACEVYALTRGEDGNSLGVDCSGCLKELDLPVELFDLMTATDESL